MEEFFVLRRTRNIPPRCGFTMNYIGIRCPDNLQSPLAQPKTKVYVVKVLGQVLIKAAEIIKDRFSQHHACSCYGGIILRQHESSIHRRVRLRRKTLEGMTSQSVESKHDPSML